MASSWSAIEVEATVADYFEMLDNEIRGQHYSKTDHRRRLLGLLNNRSEGAIERKHQNISAILIELGFVYISGYKPLSNYQRMLQEVVTKYLGRKADLVSTVLAKVKETVDFPSIEDILSAMMSPPTPDRFAAKIYKQKLRDNPIVRQGVNYLEIEARNRSLGSAGEAFVVQYEIARLMYAGKDALSEKVERVSVSQGDGLGYDVLSFETSGRERLIEVKTTAYGPSTPFYVTKNEVSVSFAKSDRYHLFRAYNFRKKPRLYSKRGALENEFILDPTQYVARIT